ncbi:MAG: hypothetical protein ACTHMM_05420 [Agriterribacter sp.]
MIAKPTLKKLVDKRLIDAKVLLDNRRYFTSVYIAGYTLELALKYRICKIMQFTKGFPENKVEFDIYYADAKKVLLRTTIKELRDIRHHKLITLLRYSGHQFNVETNFMSEWNVVKDWSPEMRYIDRVIRKQRASDFFKNVRVIIKEIL